MHNMIDCVCQASKAEKNKTNNNSKKIERMTFLLIVHDALRYK
jgi:hypothetical protein